MDQNTNQNPNAGEKTFTQEQVNAIVSERLAKERTKGETAFAEREQQFAERERQLANREALLDLKEQLKDMGLPAELLPVLNVQDKDALKAALDALKDIKNKSPREIVQNTLPTGNPNGYDDSDADAQLRKAMRLSKSRVVEE